MLRKIARALLPQKARHWTYVNVIYPAEVSRKFFGVFDRDCNICGFHGRFLAAGHPPRYDARCPKCSSGERQRFIGLYIANHKEELLNARILHFAAEAIFWPILEKLSTNYKTADIEPWRGEIQLNLENIDLEDQSVDVIICSHVLEHVDDKKALMEIFRVIRPGGRCILMVPLVEGWESTYENPLITSRKDREAHFGLDEHVRFYGKDFRNRIVEVGFELEEITAEEPAVLKHGLVRGDKIFVGHRRA